MEYLASVSRRSFLASMSSTIAAASLVLLIAGCGGNGDNKTSQWVASWFAPQQNYNEQVPLAGVPAPAPVTVTNETIRQVIHPSYGGNLARVKMSNIFGTAPVTFSAVRIARSVGNGAIDASSDTAVTFNGSTSLTLAPGAESWSDSANITYPTQTDLAVSIFVQASTPVATVHTLGQQTNFTAAGNQISAATLSGATSTTSFYWVSGIDISTTDKVKMIVAFGDSITDGAASTVSANHRWPNLFDDRVQAAASSIGRASVVNAGIAGNRWLNEVVGAAGQGRFSRDVLALSGVTHVVILLGINDIGFGKLNASQTVSADQVTGAISAATAQAKAKGLKVFLATLLPYQGALYFDPTGETKRQAVNAFVRSAPGIDGVIDFDKIMQDPSNPSAMLPAYDSGDHLHPNDAGYLAMANSIDLKILQ
ncbi:Lysophospholipase L1 [Burkholderia sp. D7]|nr:Lysophospholipase L1 [Burkholderia sp. D7]